MRRSRKKKEVKVPAGRKEKAVTPAPEKKESKWQEFLSRHSTDQQKLGGNYEKKKNASP